MGYQGTIEAGSYVLGAARPLVGLPVCDPRKPGKPGKVGRCQAT